LHALNIVAQAPHLLRNWYLVAQVTYIISQAINKIWYALCILATCEASHVTQVMVWQKIWGLRFHILYLSSRTSIALATYNCSRDYETRFRNRFFCYYDEIFLLGHKCALTKIVLLMLDDDEPPKPPRPPNPPPKPFSLPSSLDSNPIHFQLSP